MGWAEIDKDKVMKLLRKDLGDEALKLLKNKKTLINSSMPREVIAVTEDLLKIHNEITKKGLQPRRPTLLEEDGIRIEDS